MMKYSDLIVLWLKDLGYTHCFTVGGGNIMHLVESCSRHFVMVPTVHEVAAGIAVEYFNEVSKTGRAFALLTAGPGLTNAVTAFAGAWLESRELLVIGGQVKTADLSHGQVRQRGIQEIDGVAIVRSLCRRAERLDHVLNKHDFQALAQAGSSGRKGPVFIEFPLDLQARSVDADALGAAVVGEATPAPIASDVDISHLVQAIAGAERPMFLLGGGVSRETAARLDAALEQAQTPVVTTWNGADRVRADHPCYFGRANTWGQRSANLLMQQADLLVVFGSRLGLQQTGFNWARFVPGGRVVQIDCDPAELQKGHPKVDVPICADADDVLIRLLQHDLGRRTDWMRYCRMVRDTLPAVEPNVTGEGFLSPFRFAETLSDLCQGEDVVIPCSSGGAFTVMMQTFAQKQGQIIVTNKGLASMGYGLSGAIGAAFASGRRTVLIEGDGGFAQNLQEIGTAMVNRLNLKIFIFDDNGYASIRTTQANYFEGRYVGCDTSTGLGLPNLSALFESYGTPVMKLALGFETDPQFLERFTCEGPAAFIVPVDPAQTYFPKITSRITESGGMESNPLDQMSPPLDEAMRERVGRYLPR